MANVYWRGTTSTLWSDSGNWSPSKPTTGDSVYLDASSSNDLVCDEAIPVLAQFEATDGYEYGFDLNGKTLWSTGDVLLNGDDEDGAGTLDLDGTIVINSNGGEFNVENDWSSVVNSDSLTLRFKDFPSNMSIRTDDIQKIGTVKIQNCTVTQTDWYYESNTNLTHMTFGSLELTDGGKFEPVHRGILGHSSDNFKMTVEEYTNGDWDGSAGDLSEIEGDSTVGITIDLPNAISTDYVTYKNCNATPYAITALIVDGNVDGGNNSGVRFGTYGTYTVGTSGDYATLAEAFNSSSTLTGNMTLQQISDLTETASSSLDFTNSEYTLTIENSNPHYGDPSGGYIITVGAMTNWLVHSNTGGAGTGDIILKDLNVNFSGAVTRGLYLTASAGVRDIIIENLLLNGNGNLFYGLLPASSVTTVKCYNFIILNSSSTGLYNFTGSGNIFENGTIYDCTSYGFNGNNNTATIRNVASIGNGTDFVNIGSASGYNNACSDTSGEDADFSTGSGNISNISAGTVFQSTDAADSNFLYPVEEEALNGAGSNPTISGHTKYINDVDIVTDNVDIGAIGLLRAVVGYTKSVFGTLLGVKPGVYNKGSRSGTLLGIKRGF